MMPQMWANERPVLPSQCRYWCKKKDALELESKAPC